MTFHWPILFNPARTLRGSLAPTRLRIAPLPAPWWESLSLPYGTMTVLTAQAAEYDAALEGYVGAVLTDIAEQGWHRAPPPRAGRRNPVVPLASRPPRLPPAG